MAWLNGAVAPARPGGSHQFTAGEAVYCTTEGYCRLLNSARAIILEWFGRKFAVANYSLVLVMKSLTYFEDAEKDPAPDMLTLTSWEEVRRYFIQEVPHLL